MSLEISTRPVDATPRSPAADSGFQPVSETRTESPAPAATAVRPNLFAQVPGTPAAPTAQANQGSAVEVASARERTTVPPPPTQLTPQNVHETHNVVRLTPIEDTAFAIGSPIPGGEWLTRLPGIGGAPAAYVLGNRQNYQNPTVFLGVPLDPAGVSAGTVLPIVNAAVGDGPLSDAIAGTLLRQLDQLNRHLSSKETPANVKIVPQLVMTAPVGEMGQVATGQGLGSLQNGQIGVGAAVIFMKPDGKGGMEPSKTVFFNNRISIARAQDALERGEPVPVDRTINGGFLLNNVPIGGGQRANVGAGTSIAIQNNDPDRPFALQYGNTVVELPSGLGDVLNVLSGQSPSLGGAVFDGIEQLFDGMGIDGSFTRRAAEIGGNVLSVGSNVAGMASMIALGLKKPPLGAFMAARALIDGYQALDSHLVDRMVGERLFDPEVALPRTTGLWGNSDQAVAEAKTIGDVVDRAIESGAISVEDAATSWLRVANAPRAPGDVDAARRALVANAVLGRPEEAQRIATELGNPISDFAGEGIAVALRDVGSGRVRDYLADDVLDATGPDGAWRKIRLRAVDDEENGFRFVALRNSDNSQFYEMPADIARNRAGATEFVRRSLAAGAMNDSFVADPPRDTISEMLRMPLEDGEVNRDRMTALWNRWLDANPNSSLVVISDFLVSEYNEPGASEEVRANVSNLYARPELAPMRTLNRTIFRDGTDRIGLPTGARGENGLFEANEVAAAIAGRRERLGEREYNDRLLEAARELHRTGWPLNFGSPDLQRAIEVVERERGPIQPSAAFERNRHRYAF